MSSGGYFGKYRGTVAGNVDPLKIGRIQVIVPDVGGMSPGSWAMPCMPVAGNNMGMYAPPSVGSAVWVEFEQGDADYPVWVGCFWGSAAEMPSLAQAVPQPVPAITLQTTGKNGIVISDLAGASGGIQIQHASGAVISVCDTGIVISNGSGAKISLSGKTVDINDGALSVT